MNIMILEDNDLKLLELKMEIFNHIPEKECNITEHTYLNSARRYIMDNTEQKIDLFIIDMQMPILDLDIYIDRYAGKTFIWELEKYYPKKDYNYKATIFSGMKKDAEFNNSDIGWIHYSPMCCDWREDIKKLIDSIQN